MGESQKPWPSEWLMTDERIGSRLWEAIARLPPGRAGIVFRHYRLAAADRHRLGGKIAALARARGLTLAVARDERLARQLGADLAHNPRAPTDALPFSLSVHDESQALAARHAGAALVFVSPVHPTASHPGMPALGVEEAFRLARAAGCPAIALGGMDRTAFREMRSQFHGWAGIGAWLRDQPPRI